MSLFKQLFVVTDQLFLRGLRLATLLLAPLLLAACTFAPVYGDRAAADSAYNLAFESPGSRLEQIVVNELVARFGRSEDPGALFVAIKISSSSVRPGPNSVSVEGLITVTDPANDDALIFTGSRTASASFSKSSQSLANQQAANEAAERAANQLAETIRLTLLGVLLNRQPQVDAQTETMLPDPQ